jgi:predicted outer membrane repeat protein
MNSLLRWGWTAGMWRAMVGMLSALLLCAALLSPARPQVASAAASSIACGDVAGLIAAINTANTNNQADTIDLAAGCTYTLTAINNTGDGPNGLPMIVSDGGNALIINGNGATITRVGAASFRLIYVASGATLSIQNLTLSNGQNDGGAALNYGTLSVSNSIISGNQSGTGTILSFGTLTIDQSTFAGNTAGNGGALYAGGAVTITNSTFSGNATVNNDGGAIFAIGTMNIANSTFSGNSSVGYGGALVTTAGGGSPAVTINNSTFVQNTARYGGAIFVFNGSVTLQNTIVANSLGGANCFSVISLGNNLSSDNSCGGGSGDLLNADPLLGPLANNDGPTSTHALLAGSPAADAGNTATCAATDQRGIARPQGSACDIGAFERARLFIVTNESDGGPGSLRQAIRSANANPNTAGPDAIYFNIPGAGAHTIAPITALPTITDPLIIDGATQPGYAGRPVIELSGANTSGATGLQVGRGGDSTIRGLAINRFEIGIALTAALSNTVEGNYIGTDLSGTVARGNNTAGILIDNSSNNRIGGLDPAGRNLIAGNTIQGVLIQNNASGNVVQGNYIGTDASGAAALANGFTGINIINAGNNLIGGTTPGARNVISGNQVAGVGIQFASSNNTVQGNYIGVAADGATALGNTRGSQAGWGVVIINGSPNDNRIGGDAAGNLIAYNDGPAVAVYAGTGNAVLGNTIFANGGLGIELAGNGITANDPGDPDSGPNNVQNFPVLGPAAIDSSGNLTVQYNVDSAPGNSAYPLRVELFKADGSQGRTLLGADTAAAPGAHSITAGIAGALGVVAGDTLVATATDNNGNTSEFSTPAIVPHTPPLEGKILIISSPLLTGTLEKLGAEPFAVARSNFDILITVVDTTGHIATDFNRAVTLGLRPGASGVAPTLRGTTVVTASAGIARFGDLSIDPAGRGYQLLASADGLLVAIGAPFDVLEPEDEPNGSTGGAALLRAPADARAGWIANQDDGDWFAFDTSLAGATVAISLTYASMPSNMTAPISPTIQPLDYDLALVSDPRALETDTLTDGVSLANINDAGQIDKEGRAIAAGVSDSIGRISRIGGVDAAALVLAISATRDTGGESLVATLPRKGRYYLLVYSAAGTSSAYQPYRLDARLSGGTPPPAPPPTQPADTLPGNGNAEIQTIFLYNSARMIDRYTGSDDVQAIGELLKELQSGSSLMNASAGASIDLSSKSQLGDTVHSALKTLYDAWDRPDNQHDNRSKPEFANQIAQQIWDILHTAINRYYPKTTNIVLVGGDDIIPFYRVPDETTVAPEHLYYDQLLTTDALSTTSALAGSLHNNTIQTDDFYADTAPTAWRGRQLFVPDLGIGRLVERPTEIMNYLNAYASGDYTIRADEQTAAALVTGYDFVAPDARAIRDVLGGYGFTGGAERPSLTTLISDTWDVKEFANLWFGDTSTSTSYQVASLNGHFSHFQLYPADAGPGTFDAERLDSKQTFFKNALIYSIGCHSGLSATDTAFSGQNAALLKLLQADFAAGIVGQGGTWIGNTGFAYADPQANGYSSRLARLFTEQIGRRALVAGAYAGAPIGESLARAKQQYLSTIGPGGFSVTDEKTIVQMTLYGLPFMRVRVPLPADLPTPAMLPFPPDQLDNTGTLTRTVVVNNSFEMVQVGDGQIPRVTATISDSYRLLTETLYLTGTDQLSPGRPVLPALAYDITLPPNPNCQQNCAIPQPRGVRLKSATTLQDIGFAPHNTTTVTDPVGLDKQAPELSIRNLWLPDVPYTFQRTSTLSGTEPITSDRLLISPAQFRAADSRSGQLRRFTQMVLEVSYADPVRADPKTLWCFLICTGSDNSSSGGGGHGLASLADAPGLSLSTEVIYSEAIGLREVSATYTVDGINWRRVLLNKQESLTADIPGFRRDLYSVSNLEPFSNNLAVFFEALDKAGNVSVTSLKGVGTAQTIYLPSVDHRLGADLVGSVSLSPDKRAFAAGEPVQLSATITNTGDTSAGPFWVDLFINPSTPPTTANITWNSVCAMDPCFGLTWKVPGLAAGESITLTSEDFPPGYSIWPGWFAAGTTDLYLYVDSWNPGVNSGAVFESNESNNAAHVGGLRVTGHNPPLVSVRSADRLPVRPAP